MCAAVGIRRWPELRTFGRCAMSAVARSPRQIRSLQSRRSLSTLPCSFASASSACRRRSCPHSSSAASSSCCAAACFLSRIRQTVRSFATAHVDELRTGHIIEHEGKLCKVVSHEAHMRGRSHTTITLELRDLSTGKSSTVRLRPSDKVDQVTLESETLTFLYRDSRSLHLLHPVSFETVELPLSAIAAQHLPFLADNSPVRATRRGSAYLDIALPDRVKGKVTRTEGVKGGGRSGVNDAGVRRALLDNGEWIDNVPNNVEAGDVILINTITMAFVQRE